MIKEFDSVVLLVQKGKFPKGSVGVVVDYPENSLYVLVELEEDWPHGFIWCHLDELSKY